MKNALFVGISSLILTGCQVSSLFTQQQAALQVDSQPSATVYLDDNHVGETPFYDDNLKPGEYSLRIQVANNPQQEWQNNITLNPGLVTAVKRTFGETSEKSSHYIIQMEQLPNEDRTEISVITIPDNVIVKLDGQPEGFSPISLQDISPGNHNLTLVAPGYSEQTVDLNVEAGYKLIVSASLAKTQALLAPQEPIATRSGDLTDQEATPEAELDTTPTPTPRSSRTSTATSSADLEPPYVTITETGTGWLRVRSAPNAYEDNEVARVNVGESYPFLDSNTAGWYQIEYEPGEEGWISGRYADITE